MNVLEIRLEASNTVPWEGEITCVVADPGAQHEGPTVILRQTASVVDPHDERHGYYCLNHAIDSIKSTLKRENFQTEASPAYWAWEAL